MRRKLLLSLVALTLLTAPASASSDEGSIDDPRGDVVPQDALELAPADTVPPELTPEEIGQAGDVVGAHIVSESATAFTIVVELDDIPDVDQNVSTPFVEVWAHFDTQGATYHASAVLAMPPEDGKLEARYMLYRGDAELGEMQGAVDKVADTVTFVVDKARVGNPQFGDKLTKFYVTTQVPTTQLILDYAPDADPFDPTSLDPFDPGLLPTAEYGTDYTFGKYQGAVSADLDVSVTPSSVQVQPGQQATVSISVKNSAPQSDTVTLASGNVPSGWSVRFDTTQLTLAPGQGRLVSLFLVPPGDTPAGQSLVTLRLLSSLGADQESALSVQVMPPPTTNPPPSASPPPASSGSGGPVSPPAAPERGDQDPAGADEENGAPMPAALVVLAALGASALAARRRR